MNEEEFQRIQQLRFEHAVEGMLDQDVQAMIGSGCVYVTQSGLRCAVGHCLTERGAWRAEQADVGVAVEEIKQAWFKPELRLKKRLSGQQTNLVTGLLEDLQDIHDMGSWGGGEAVLRVAEKYDLDPGILVTWIYDDE